MSEAQQGQTAKVHYTGRLEDDTVFDTSREGEPLQLELGENEVIPGFEQAVVGMSPGETKTVTLEPEQAYGARRDDLVFDLERDRLPDDPERGQQLQLQHPSGTMIPVTVVEVNPENVTVDANHVLAGRTLIFDIELIGLQNGAAENGAAIQESA